MAVFLTPNKKMNAGEKRFVDLLKRYLDDDYLIWFDVPTRGKYRRYPDFLIFHPKLGLLCIEVKDWQMKDVVRMDSEAVYYRHGEGQSSRTNPLKQARECLLPIIELMGRDQSLLQKHGKYQGKLAVPWSYGCVMWRWDRTKIKSEYLVEVEKQFPSKHTFFREELEDEALSQETFLAKLHGMFPYQFDQPLSKAQSDKVRGYIFPEFIVGRQGDLFAVDDEPSDVLPDIVHIMDNQQERTARNMGDGHRVIHGVAGSGKTILLEHRAKKLAESKPDKPILVLCYNIVLARRLQQRLPSEYIQVFHFHGWCSHLKKAYHLDVLRENNQEYFDALTQTVCQAVAEEQIPHELYHAVLIDEGHDFAADWLRTAAKMPDAEHQHLLLLYDDAQSIYDNNKGIDFPLSSVGIQALGRTSILRVNYRNPIEILSRAEDFLSHFILHHESKTDDDIPLLLPESQGWRSGIDPVFFRADSQDDELDYIVHCIHNWCAKGIPLGEMAILYSDHRFGKRLDNACEQAKLDRQFLCTADDKKHYQADSDKLTLCTIHSSKGSEFKYVILAGIDRLSTSDDKRDDHARLIYVGMTRAVEALVMTASGDNEFTELLAE